MTNLAAVHENTHILYISTHTLHQTHTYTLHHTHKHTHTHTHTQTQTHTNTHYIRHTHRQTHTHTHTHTNTHSLPLLPDGHLQVVALLCTTPVPKQTALSASPATAKH